jgi:4-hydroxysphinganine ceramide fatty acyl 2-hydroxylase
MTHDEPVTLGHPNKPPTQLASQRDKRPHNIPFSVFKRDQARISRGRMYPFTVFYSVYATVVLIIALLSEHPLVAVGYYLAGIPVWTLVEYLFHRYILHGRFPSHDSIIGRYLHDRLDPLHWEHHERPFDAMHVSGELKDLLPVFVIAAPVSFLFPIYTAPVLLAGAVQSYVFEEWIHHSVHYYDFKSPYFRYIKRFHRYHHSEPGMNHGYGLTSGVWDALLGTHYPRSIRTALFGRREG